MKYTNILIKIITGILVTIIAGVIVYSLTAPKPNIRYSLSGPISVNVSNAIGNVQQLDIKNFGDAEGKDINIKINGKNISYELIKYSSSDSEQIYKYDRQLEIMYPKLPPEAQISIILKTQEPISIKDISIYNSNGKAKEILSKSNNFLLDYIIIILGYIIMTLYFGRLTAISSLESKVRYRPNDILSSKMPFYISEEKWKSIRDEAIENKVIKDFTAFYDYPRLAIENDNNYKFLSSEKPDYLNNNEWKILLKKSNALFNVFLDYRLSEENNYEKVFNFLLIQKPKYYNQIQWNDFIKRCNDKYISLKKDKLFRYSSSSDNYVKEIKSEKPSEINQEIWDEYINRIISYCITILHFEIITQSNPIEYLENIGLDYTTLDGRILMNKAYKIQLSKITPIKTAEQANKFINQPKPKWMQQLDYTSILDEAKSLLRVEQEKSTYLALINICKSLIKFEELPTNRPDNIDEDTWNRLYDIDSKLKAETQELKNKAEKLEIREKQIEGTEKLRDKVLKQLSVINEFLNDQTVLNRIEEYEDIFASGNLANLRKIADKLTV